MGKGVFRHLRVCTDELRYGELFRAAELQSVCPVIGVAMPHCDLKDPYSLVLGNRLRAGKVLPKPTCDILPALERTTKWLLDKLCPAEDNYDYSVEAWLEKTSFSKTRKDAILREYLSARVEITDDPLSHDKESCILNIFPKDECYPLYKSVRSIFAPEDILKAWISPYIKAVEEQVYAMEYFIKHIPFKERAKFVADRFGVEGRVGASDYSSWEAFMESSVMAVTMVLLYKYVLQRADPRVVNFICDLKTKPKDLKCRYFYAKADLLPSGMPDTAVTTAFVSLVVALTILPDRKSVV